VLYRALSAAVEMWESGDRTSDHLRATMHQIIEAESLARIDYISVANPNTLHEIEGEVESALFSMAVFVGATRLIDNMLVGIT
jgi:pantoate--beta-alanine ligase